TSRPRSKSGLEFLPGLKSNCFTRRDVGDFTGSWVAADASLARLHNEYTKAAKLDALASLKSSLHRVKQRFNCDLGLHLRYAGLIGYMVDDVELDHVVLRSSCFFVNHR